MFARALVAALMLVPLGCAVSTEPRPGADSGEKPGEGTPTQLCTRIGCVDGLTVVVEDAPAAPYTVEVTLPDGTSRTARCEDPSGCGDGLFIEGVIAERVTVRVVAEAGTRSYDLRPDYRRLQPNGPDCPPTCKHARVTVRYAA